MPNQKVLDALQLLADSLSMGATASNGVISAQVIPDLGEVNLADFALGGLAEPIEAPINLTAVVKEVAFPTGEVTDGSGSLIAGPLPDAPGFGAGETPDTPLAGVQGLLIGLSGTIGLPAPSPPTVPVSAEICWQAQLDPNCQLPSLIDKPAPTQPQPAAGGGRLGIRDDIAVVAADVLLEDRDFLACSSNPNQGLFGLRTSSPEIELPVLPPLTAMTAGHVGSVCYYKVTARVRLKALGESLEVEVPPISVPVPAIPVPTVLAVFSEVRYSETKDGAKMVIVPMDLPVDAEGAIDQLRTVQSALAKVQTIARVATFLTGLNRLFNAIKPPLDSRHKLLFRQLNETRDLGKTASDWRHRGWGLDDHGAEDEIDSMILVSIDQKVELWANAGFKGDRVAATPSPTIFTVMVPNFNEVTTHEPADSDVQADNSHFHDRAHSLKFSPR